MYCVARNTYFMFNVLAKKKPHLKLGFLEKLNVKSLKSKLMWNGIIQALKAGLDDIFSFYKK